MATLKTGSERSKHYTPPRKRRKFFVVLLMSSDAAVFALALRIAYLFRFEAGLFETTRGTSQTLSYYTSSVYLFIPVLTLLFAFYKLYDWDHLFGGSGEFTRAVTAVTMSLFAIVIISFLVKAPTISRPWLFSLWFVSCALVVFERYVLRSIIYSQRRKGVFLSRYLIVGANDEGRKIAEQALKMPSSGLQVIGFVDDFMTKSSSIIDGVKVLGKTGQLARIIDEHRIEGVIFSSTAFSHGQMVEMIQALKGRIVDIHISSGLFEILMSRVMVKEVSGIPLVGIKNVTLSTGELIAKTIFDRTVAFVGIALISPLLLLITIMIKTTSDGPLIYASKRVGRHGREFHCYKFRSMVADADRRLDKLSVHNEASGYIFKMKNDPRVTKVGAILRKFSLDELPQLFNVLKGDMSLVGPRPPIPAEVVNYNDWHWRRLDVIPGMTGLWQISGRSDLTFDEMVKLDLYYIENWSLAFDVIILLKTVAVVLRGQGAY